MSALPAKVDILVLGFSVKIFEAAGGIGGTWYWNCYPGSRVDTNAPNQIPIDGLWQNWSYATLFPDWKELREYSAYIDRTLDLSGDISLNARVVAAEFEEAAG
ncbi:hypothetical protein BDN71DRAFT_1500230 [Pleurotus eryngii]|uniref:Uncharacterized protein n=1 Tax=Pleurotus eryngii TaxID=5323 RepID=A0A9P6ABC0_PLEER|nr:hypothetical protein BDN71DRAFT_1500230 [Pleurotus eryngii]